MKTRRKGAALLEFALILPLLLLLAFITTEFGRAMYQYNTVAKSVRDAVRYLSMQTPGSHLTEARNLVVYGNVGGTGSPLALALAVPMVSASWQATGSNPVINTVTVTVSGYAFTPLYRSVFGLAFADASGNIVYSDISASMRSSI